MTTLSQRLREEGMPQGMQQGAATTARLTTATREELERFAENLLHDLLLPYQIDLSLYDQIDNADLKAHIVRVGREL